MLQTVYARAKESRGADITDVITNTAGGLMGYAICALSARIRRRIRR